MKKARLGNKDGQTPQTAYAAKANFSSQIKVLILLFSWININQHMQLLPQIVCRI